MSIKNFRDLNVWQEGMSLSVEVYKSTGGLPGNEQYGLVSRMRRCAVSVPANIAEGYERQHDKELRQFLHISRGSLAELQTYLLLCVRLEYLDTESVGPLLDRACTLAKMINAFIAKINEG